MRRSIRRFLRRKVSKSMVFPIHPGDGAPGHGEIRNYNRIRRGEFFSGQARQASRIPPRKPEINRAMELGASLGPACSMVATSALPMAARRQIHQPAANCSGIRDAEADGDGKFGKAAQAADELFGIGFERGARAGDA